MSLPIRRLASFGALQLVATIAPIAVLPLVVRMIGASGWVGMSIGYGVGAAAASVVALGWPVSGPPLVAAAATDVRAVLFRESLATRAAAAVVATAAAAGISAALSPRGHGFLAAAMAAAITSWGLTPSWYYVGIGQPRGILVFETLPRLAATMASIPVVALTREAVSYPGLLLLASLGSFVISARRILGSTKGPWLENGWRARLRGNVSLSLGNLIGAGYTNLAVPIATAAQPGVHALADLAASSRIRSMSQMGTASVATAFQGWVAEEPAQARSRRRAAFALTTAVGLITAALLFVIGPFISGILFGSNVRYGWLMSAVTAAGVIPYALGATLSFHCLAPAGMHRQIASSRIAATIVGVPMLYVGVRHSGAVGGAAASAASEFVVVALQALAWRRLSAFNQPDPACSSATRSDGVPTGP